ncbi:MAG: thiamine-phosphate kinase [Nitrospiraceae bacterium]|nr:MAG: thiamine-phosphate kinase [Nitrospiraceae bacterium]
MRLSDIGEFGLIQKLRAKCRKPSTGIISGIGDDAAVIKAGNRKILVTADMMLEDIHFDLSLSTFYQLGWKFLAVNISDIFAMGGKPKYFFVSLGIPKARNTKDLDELYAGMLKIAGQYSIVIAGGDTCASADGLVLSGSLIGEANRIITRAGAREGDGIFVTDTVGDSAMGLTLLKGQGARGRGQGLIKKHLMPDIKPLKNTSKVTSMIDISDGLLIDLSHICDESRVGALLYSDRIPISVELRKAAAHLGKDPLEFALKGGEDYALLFTAPKGARKDAYQIGEIVRKGRFMVDARGKKTRFRPEGYEHFK